MASVEMSPADLQKILEAVIGKVQQLNPLDQRKYDEILAREKRRDLLAVQLGKAEEEAYQRRKNGCSHLRYPATAGKLSGHMAPPGYHGAEWRTGGQVYQNGLAMMLCLHCATSWWFKPTPEYYAVLAQNGLDSTAPPPDDKCICIGCYEPKPNCTCAAQSREHAAAHPTVEAVV
jgi:hypothetical protein